MKRLFKKVMNKRVLFKSLCVFLTLHFSINAIAQEDDTGGGGIPLKFGVKAGATISSFTSQQPHNNLILGATGGGFILYEVNQNIFIQLEAMYSQEGGRLLSFDYPSLVGKETWFGLTAANQQIVLHNINIPLLFKYQKSISNFKIAGYLGPDFGYLLKGVSRKEATVFTEIGGFHTYTESEDISSNIESYNIAATAGLGIEIPSGKFNILIDARFRYGITPVYKSYSYVGIPQIKKDLQNHTISLTLGIGF